MKLYQNRPINNSARGMTRIFFIKNSNCDLVLAHKGLDNKFDLDIVTLNTCVKLNQNLSIYKMARGDDIF